MTETAPPPRDVAQDAIAITAETMGHDFLAAMLAELRQMPDHWARLNEQRQQQIIERLREKVRTGIDKALTIFMRGEFPAVQADLKAIAWENGIKATLAIPKDAMYRHALCDAQGSKVLIVLTDAGRWLARMDEIKAKGDQIDLFDADYDPARDQPGYRRDQDRVAPAGPTWEALKKSLQGPTPMDAPPTGDAPAPADGQPAGETAQATPVPELPREYTAQGAAPIDRRHSTGVEGEGTWEPVKLKQIQRGDVIRLPGIDAVMIATTPSLKGKGGEYTVQVEPEPALTFGSAATAEEERTATLRILQEQLASIGVGISLGAVQAFTVEQVEATTAWAAAYAAGADSCKIARPLWLPIPEQKGDQK